MQNISSVTEEILMENFNFLKLPDNRFVSDILEPVIYSLGKY